MRTVIATLTFGFCIQISVAQQVTSSARTSAPGTQPSAEVATTFRSQSESVLVPVVVLAKHGEHVSGLSKDAFEIKENGKEQTVASSEEMHPQENAPDSESAEDSHSNLRLDPSYQPQLTILVLDFFNATPIQRTDGKDQLIRFLSKNFQGTGTFSLVCMTSDGLRVLRTFTEDKAELVRILQNLNTEGYWLKGHQEAVHWTLDQVRQIAQAYKGVPGRKTMVWFSGNIPYPHVDSRDTREQQLRDDFDETRKSLLSANIAVYPVGLLAAAIDEWQVAQDIRQTDSNARLGGSSFDAY